MNRKVGMRVFAIRNSEAGRVYLYGFGTYEGDEAPDKEAQGVKGLSALCGGKNPKILLDNGKVVWGCECWWGPEEKFYEKFANAQIIEVDIVAERMKQTGEIN